MVSDPILTAIIAGVFTILGSSISYLSTKKSSEEATKRLYRRHALEEKFNAFRELYVAFDECSANFEGANLQGVSDMENYEESIRQPFAEVQRAWDIASIYVEDEDDIKKIEDAIDVFNDSRTYLKSMARTLDDDYYDSHIAYDYERSNDELEKAFEDVKSVLKPRLDPLDTNN